MIPRRLDQTYSNVQPFLERLKENVGQTLGAFTDRRNFPFSGRIKSVNSVAEKIETGRYKRFSDIDDLVAFNIVIPNALVENEVRDICNSAFHVVETKDKTTAEKAPDVFRFDSTRLVSKLRQPPDFEKSVAKSIYDFKFEIQVRTAFEHAWSVATHDLAYKASVMDWKRLRLAAQLKAGTESMDAAVAAFNSIAAAIDASPCRKMDDRQAVCEAIVGFLEQKLLPTELTPHSLSRFSENFCSLVRNIQPSTTVTDCLNIIREELASGSSIPVSLSLYQFFLGILFRRKKAIKLKKISCDVGEELATLFPEVNVLFPFIYDQ